MLGQPTPKHQASSVPVHIRINASSAGQQSPMKTRQLVLIGTLIFLAGIVVGRAPATLRWITGATAWSDAFEESRELLRDRYVEPVSDDDLLRGAIHGMAASLNDPYTEFVPPSSKASFEKDLTGQYIGIGCQIGVRNGELTVVSPLEDSGALEAGIQPGDRIIAIDTKPTKGLALDDAMALLKGPDGNVVALTIARGGATLTISVTRRPVIQHMVRGVRWNTAAQDWEFTLSPSAPASISPAEKPIAYIRLEQFTDTAPAELRAAFKASGIVDGKAEGLILDLRGNPGGSLEAARDIADMFLNDQTIVTIRDRAGMTETIKAAGQPIVPAATPIVVLVDEGSASASEVVAGALADNARGIIVGQRSYGKGLVQIIEPLRSLPDAQLKITEQKFYLPSGRLIQRTEKSTAWGVDPTPGFEIALDPAKAESLAKAREQADAIWPKGTHQPEPTAWHDADWVESTAGDAQLAAAMRAISKKFAAGTWTPPLPPIPPSPTTAPANP